MMKISHLAFTGILWIFGCGYLTPLLGCAEGPGYVYILRDPLNEWYQVSGASGAPPLYMISGQTKTASFDVTRFPVSTCIRAFSGALAAARSFRFRDHFGEFGDFFRVDENRREAFFHAIEAVVAPYAQINIPPTDWLRPCENSPGFVHMLYMLIAEKGQPPFYCVKIFGSSQKVDNPMPMFHIIKLPLRRIWPDHSRYYSYEVRDCEEALRLARTEIDRSFLRGFWKDYKVYGDDFIKPIGAQLADEDLDRIKEVVESALHRFEVTPTESTSTALIED